MASRLKGRGSDGLFNSYWSPWGGAEGQGRQRQPARPTPTANARGRVAISRAKPRDAAGRRPRVGCRAPRPQTPSPLEPPRPAHKPRIRSEKSLFISPPSSLTPPLGREKPLVPPTAVLRFRNAESYAICTQAVTHCEIKGKQATAVRAVTCCFSWCALRGSNPRPWD